MQPIEVAAYVNTLQSGGRPTVDEVQRAGIDSADEAGEDETGGTPA
jgi:hypothetical protein